MTTDELARSILTTARKRAGSDGAVTIEAAKIIVSLIQAVQVQAQAEEPEAGEGWLMLIRAALPEARPVPSEKPKHKRTMKELGEGLETD